MMWLAATWLVLAAGPSADSFDAFFQEFAKKRDGIRTLEARFEQENITTEETIRAGGSIIYVKPRRIVFRYDTPDPGTTYLIDNQKAYEYEPDIKQLQIYDLKNNPQTEVFFLGFDNDTEELRKAYDVAVFKSDQSGGEGRGILIRPKKTEGEESQFREVKLYLRDADYLPYKIHIENDDDSQVDIRIVDFKVNGELDPARKQIELAEGTKIIEDDTLIETVGPGGKRVPAEETVSVTPLNPPTKPTEVK